MKNFPNRNGELAGSGRLDGELPSGRLSVIPARAFDDRRMSDRVRSVLGVLGTYSDRDGWCWPGQNTIAKRLGVSRSTIRGHLDRLVDLGYLQVKERKRPNGSATTNMYRVVFDSDLGPEWDRMAELPSTIPLPVVVPSDIVKPVSMYDTAQSLAAVCIMAFDANKGMLLAESKKMTTLPQWSIQLLKDTYDRKDGDWYMYDFRGRKGQPPTPKQIRETWQQYAVDSAEKSALGEFSHG